MDSFILKEFKKMILLVANCNNDKGVIRLNVSTKETNLPRRIQTNKIGISPIIGWRVKIILIRIIWCSTSEIRIQSAGVDFPSRSKNVHRLGENIVVHQSVGLFVIKGVSGLELTHPV